MTADHAPSPPRVEPSAALVGTPLVAVLRAERATDYDPVIDALVNSGVRSIEVTLSTPGTIAHLPKLLSRLGGAAEIGVGTVTSGESARDALDAGADYIVTPVMLPEIISLCCQSGTPVYPGTLTPTEVHAAWSAGATAVKIFPASTVGPEYGRHLRGPFPDIEFIPSGGVGVEDIEAWMRAGAIAVSLGGPMIGDALRGGSLRELEARARAAVQIVRELVPSR